VQPLISIIHAGVFNISNSFVAPPIREINAVLMASNGYGPASIGKVNSEHVCYWHYQTVQCGLVLNCNQFLKREISIFRKESVCAYASDVFGETRILGIPSKLRIGPAQYLRNATAIRQGRVSMCEFMKI
jgi:hypothetical protein